jgi:transcription elongation factor GreA
LSERLITGAGFARANEMLEHLKTTGRREIAERLRQVIASETNATDDADYLAVREDQVLLERKIARLEQRLANARVAEPDGANGVIDLGERVRLRDLETGERVEYELVGSLESDPAAGRISAASPVGSVLLGRRKGEVVVAEVPKGTVHLKILEIDVPVASA